MDRASRLRRDQRAKEAIARGEHPAPRKPGSWTCYTLGCRKPECREAAARYRKRNEYNRERFGSNMVDAQLILDHFTRLHVAGISNALIAKLAGVSETAVSAIARGVTVHVQVKTAKALLAIEVPASAPAVDGKYVPNVIPQRQLTALMAAGYTGSWLAEQLHTSLETVSRISRGKQPYVKGANAKAIAALADRIGLTPGPSERARRRAAREGWNLPAWYDRGWQLPAVPDEQLEKAPSHDEELLERFRVLVAEKRRLGWHYERISEHALANGLPFASRQKVRREVERVYVAERRAATQAA